MALMKSGNRALPSPVADPSTSGSPLQPSSLKKGTLILAQLPEDQFPGSGGEQYLEVLSDWDASQGRCRVAWRGRLLELSLPQQGTGDALAVSHQGARQLLQPG